MKPSEYIRKGWCQGMLARDGMGNRVRPLAPEAVAWSMLGAAEKAGVAPARMAAAAKDKLRGQNGLAWELASLRTQAEVIALLEEVGL